MKITASILALLVLFLSTQSIYVHSNIEAEKADARKTCCAHKKACKKDKEPKKDEGCNSTCNPFMVCSGCLYVHAGKTTFSFEALLNLSVKTGFKQSFFTSGYNSDCWHPPEIV